MFGRKQRPNSKSSISPPLTHECRDDIETEVNPLLQRDPSVECQVHAYSGKRRRQSILSLIITAICFWVVHTIYWMATWTEPSKQQVLKVTTHNTATTADAKKKTIQQGIKSDDIDPATAITTSYGHNECFCDFVSVDCLDPDLILSSLSN